MAQQDAIISRFQALVERFPERSPPRFSLGRALQDAGQMAAAAEQYGHAARLQPDLMMAWLHQAECLLAVGDLAVAKTSAEQARKLAVGQGHEGPLADVTELLEDIEDEMG
ncbi:MAG: hypothetical protein KC502_21190 [Myxococcales bacterium]|nr:hypothetical protein [Myxococcales bacterium]